MRQQYDTGMRAISYTIEIHLKNFLQGNDVQFWILLFSSENITSTKRRILTNLIEKQKNIL